MGEFPFHLRISLWAHYLHLQILICRPYHTSEKIFNILIPRERLLPGVADYAVQLPGIEAIFRQRPFERNAAIQTGSPPEPSMNYLVAMHASNARSEEHTSEL